MGHVAPPDRYAGVALAVRLMALIRHQPKSRAELAATLSVHERTIRRLIDALRAGGITIDQARTPPDLTLRYRTR
jgi:predicted DNA-binding transcriptional regulator YafY